ncbi:MAG: hypothetical protein EZS28_056239, partial [Streblomastix strix]
MISLDPTKIKKNKFFLNHLKNNKDFKAFVTTSSPSPQQAKKTDQNPQLDNSKTPSSLKPKFIPRKSKELDDLYIKKSDGDDRYSSYTTRPASQRFQSYMYKQPQQSTASIPLSQPQASQVSQQRKATSPLSSSQA